MFRLILIRRSLRCWFSFRYSDKGLPKTRGILDKGENNLAGQTLAIQKGLPKTLGITVGGSHAKA